MTLDTLILYLRPLSVALLLVMLITSLITVYILNLDTISSALPVSILLKSRMSLIMDRSMLPADLISPAYFITLSLSDSRIIISSIPRMAFIGVLIS